MGRESLNSTKAKAPSRANNSTARMKTNNKMLENIEKEFIRLQKEFESLKSGVSLGCQVDS